MNILEGFRNLTVLELGLYSHENYKGLSFFKVLEQKQMQKILKTSWGLAGPSSVQAWIGL